VFKKSTFVRTILWFLLFFPYSRQEIIDVFEKYIDNNVRHMERSEAIQMLRSEFGFDEDQAATMFDAFDKDKNGQMSVWEFQQFYVTLGTQ